MASASAILGTVSLILCTFIFEYAHIWFALGLIGLILGIISYKKGDKNGKTGIILNSISLAYSLVFVIILISYYRSLS